eukprot:CAMPEP_0171942474 /NCGR_PEP_ID=MMETSP0993-20121228/38704_1 /TAXON_ID=483369 /ORGANISM="non described non described, Strain CCMP2098" /LENGTH=355 /DNA_ID=CAMNT_0012584911 /DNA_START=35 /DNA_END=1098 /DNA_ORIENTATION=+
MTLFRALNRFILVHICVLVVFITTNSTNARNFSSSIHCRTLGSPPPPYLAVISRWDEDVVWARDLPIPALIYEHDQELTEALYRVPVNKGSESSAYIQFVLDHYDCLPQWVLFLHAHGRTNSQGVSHAATRHHPSNPALFAAALDVNAIGRPFLAIGHFSEADWQKKSSLHPAARAWSNGANQRKQAALLERPANQASERSGDGERDASRGNAWKGSTRENSRSPGGSSDVKRTWGNGGSQQRRRLTRDRVEVYHAAYVPPEERKLGCQCNTLQRLFPPGGRPLGSTQERSVGGPVGGPVGGGFSARLGGIQEVRSCSRPWSWVIGAEFWASKDRISARSLEFWQRARSVALSGR